MSHVLTEEQRYQVVEWMGQFYPIATIHQMVKEKFGKNIDYSAIKKYEKNEKWQPMLRQLRASWAASVMDHAFAHRKGRVAELERIYERFNHVPGLTERERLVCQMKVLEQLRLEMDEGKTNFTITHNTLITGETDERLIQRRDAALKRLMELKNMQIVPALPEPAPPIEVPPEPVPEPPKLNRVEPPSGLTIDELKALPRKRGRPANRNVRRRKNLPKEE